MYILCMIYMMHKLIWKKKKKKKNGCLAQHQHRSALKSMSASSNQISYFTTVIYFFILIFPSPEPVLYFPNILNQNQIWLNIDSGVQYSSV